MAVRRKAPPPATQDDRARGRAAFGAGWAQRLTLALVACVTLAVGTGGFLRLLQVQRDAAAATLAATEANEPREVATVLASRQVVERVLTLSGELVARDGAPAMAPVTAGLPPVVGSDPQAEMARRMSEVSVTAAREGLLWMLDDGRVEFQAAVSDAELAAIVQRDGVPVAVPGIASALDGRVRLVVPRADPATGLGVVRIALPADERLRAGTLARAEFQLEHVDALTLPDSAVGRDGTTGDPAVFVIDADNRARLRRVETGRRQDGVVEIVSGLAPSERVAVDAGGSLQDGDAVASIAHADIQTASR
ncbi:efflux RND transporter periplasmic adaptor subunit [Marinivivus vitaminiproducens]|uniref:efflux RND transporter periplasmic adaptor subunit n=1 Tax=Marinivivus vitaminiproducens TaxID=3035935 RepID=UPI0027A16DBB|nr:hypothetical protein P4R82_07615 [Geminicoccaceae bacterium SCSIO 64248]